MKFILHKSGSRFYPYSEPFIDPKEEWRGKSVYLDGGGQYAWEACDVFETRNFIETLLIKLLMWYQRNITNKKL